jgi:hypothetical protein
VQGADPAFSSGNYAVALSLPGGVPQSVLHSQALALAAHADGGAGAVTGTLTPGATQTTYLTAPANLSNGYLLLNIQLPQGGSMPSLHIFAGTTEVTWQIASEANGQLTVLVSGVPAGQQYSAVLTGQGQATPFVLDARFTPDAPPVQGFVYDSAAAGSTDYYRLFVAQSQFVQFNFASAGAPALVTVFDDTGHVIATLTSGQGTKLLLPGGGYTVTVQDLSATAQAAFYLWGGGTSDPIGPGFVDPTLMPQYTSPFGTLYLYPDGSLSASSLKFYRYFPDLPPTPGPGKVMIPLGINPRTGRMMYAEGYDLGPFVPTPPGQM